MKTIEIKGHLREALGSKTAKNLRREGQVPCVVYGGESNLHFYADERELHKLIFTPNVYLVKLDIDGKNVNVVLRDAQFHPVKDNAVHVDFVEVLAGKPVSVTLPVSITGTAAGVRSGGVLRHNAKRISVRGVVDSIPDEINIDVSALKIGDSIKIADLSFPGIEFAEAANRVIVAVRTSRKAVEEETPAAEGEKAEGEAEKAAEAPAEA